MFFALYVDGALVPACLPACLPWRLLVLSCLVKGGGVGPAHEPHVLWLQLAYSSFFLQRWERALDVFQRIHKGVTEVSEPLKTIMPLKTLKPVAESGSP